MNAAARIGLLAACLIGLAAPARAQLSTCPSSATDCHLIDGALEFSGSAPASTPGVPNYDQGSFAGSNDCGPTAAAMLVGYWDSHGWPCLVDGSPYTPFGGGVSDGIVALDTALKDSSIPYGDLSIGTPPSFGLNLMSQGIREVIQARSGVDWTSAAEYEYISHQTFKNDLTADRPALLCVRVSNDEATWSHTGELTSVAWHWTTVIGFREESDDEFFFAMRSGWRQGGQTFLWYEDSMWSDLYAVHVRPPGIAPASCVDEVDDDADGFASSTPQPGFSGGLDCDDGAMSVYPQAPELCNGIDDDCDGAMDEDFDDADNDGIGDPCDPDDDNDGHLDGADNCPFIANPGQTNADLDDLGDACDVCPDDPLNDVDGDEICGGADLCPNSYQVENLDGDGDGIGDVCDICPEDPENDLDSDGLCESVDNCGRVYNPCQQDHDGDGVGDACECLGDLLSVARGWRDGSCPVFNARESIEGYLDECGRLSVDPIGGEHLVYDSMSTWESVLTTYGPSPFERMPRYDRHMPPDPLWDPARH
ncbi:MAG: putative metal-binding motif-containing protein [Sandaracinaceae bacterium]